jgi:hypothetical protein
MPDIQTITNPMFEHPHMFSIVIDNQEDISMNIDNSLIAIKVIDSTEEAVLGVDNTYNNTLTFITQLDLNE